MKKGKAAIVFVIIIFSLLFLSLGLIIGLDYLKNEKTYFIFKNIIVFSYSVSSILSIIALKKYLNFLSIILIIIQTIILIGQLYFIPIRSYYILSILLFFVSIIYTLVILVIKAIKKTRRNNTLDVPLLNAVLPTLIVGCPYFMNTIYLFDLIEMISNNVMWNSIIVGLCFSIIALILYIVLRKDRSDKKGYFGAMAGVFFGTIIVIMFIMFGTINNVNYGFDKSLETKESYLIVDKEKTHHSKSRIGHYIIFLVNGEEFKMKVNHMIYEKYDIGDDIMIYKHKGALGYSYYEYHLDSIYIYENE